MMLAIDTTPNGTCSGYILFHASEFPYLAFLDRRNTFMPCVPPSLPFFTAAREMQVLRTM